jgi:hypothetical protein
MGDRPHVACGARPAVYDHDTEGLDPMLSRQDWCRSLFVNHERHACFTDIFIR